MHLCMCVICATHTYGTDFISLQLPCCCSQHTGGTKSHGGSGAGLPTDGAFTLSVCAYLVLTFTSASFFFIITTIPRTPTRNWFYGMQLNNDGEIAEDGKSWQHENKGRVMEKKSDYPYSINKGAWAVYYESWIMIFFGNRRMKLIWVQYRGVSSSALKIFSISGGRSFRSAFKKSPEILVSRKNTSCSNFSFIGKYFASKVSLKINHPLIVCLQVFHLVKTTELCLELNGINKDRISSSVSLSSFRVVHYLTTEEKKKIHNVNVGETKSFKSRTIVTFKNH